MSEETTTPAAGEQPTEPVEQPLPDPAPEPKPTETVDFWKSKAREQEARAKSNADAAKRLQEIEDAAKSAEQRAADEAARAQQSAREATERADRAELGVEHSIGKDFLDLLGGGTREDMSARAQRLGPLLAAQRENEQIKAELAALRDGKTPPSQRPTVNLQSGASPAPEQQDDAFPAHWIPQRAN